MEFLTLIAEMLRNTQAARETRNFLYHCRGVSDALEQISNLMSESKYKLAAKLINGQLRRQTRMLLGFFEELQRPYPANEIEPPEIRLNHFLDWRLTGHGVSFNTKDFKQCFDAIIDLYTTERSEANLVADLQKDYDLNIHLTEFPPLFKASEKLLHDLFYRSYRKNSRSCYQPHGSSRQ